MVNTEGERKVIYSAAIAAANSIVIITADARWKFLIDISALVNSPASVHIHRQTLDLPIS